MKKGFAIHCHHDVLVEYCYDYDERVNFIKTQKPEREQETRLRLFKILPEEALKDVPLECQEAYQKCQEADQKYREAYQKYQEADQKYREAYQKCQEAYQKRPQEDKDAFHEKWCGCKEWNGKEIIFKENL